MFMLCWEHRMIIIEEILFMEKLPDNSVFFFSPLANYTDRAIAAGQQNLQITRILI
jgi:hypothetical protein